MFYGLNLILSRLDCFDNLDLDLERDNVFYLFYF